MLSYEQFEDVPKRRFSTRLRKRRIGGESILLPGGYVGDT